MATTVNDIHNIIDDMYNSRSKFRSVYTNLPSAIDYTLESRITKSIVKAVGTTKIGLEIDIPSFSITVLFEDNNLAKKYKSIVESSIDGVLRSFLEKELISDKEAQSYLENPGNKLMDIYTVGESIKVLI